MWGMRECGNAIVKMREWRVIDIVLEARRPANPHCRPTQFVNSPIRQFANSLIAEGARQFFCNPF